MTGLGKWRNRLGQSYWLWRVYHWVVGDAVAIQKPTKHGIVREFLGQDSVRVADVGCGPGVFTRYLAARARQVWCVDIDAASLHRVRGRHRRLANVGFAVADAECLPFADAGLNAVLMLETLEHVADDARAVRELGRVVEPGGKLVLSVPVPPGEVDDTNPWGHKREGYGLEEIVALLEGNGFAVEQHRFAEFQYSRLAGRLVKWWRQWLRVPAPIVLTWFGYLDLLLDEEKRRAGGYLPASVVILARRNRQAGVP